MDFLGRDFFNCRKTKRSKPLFKSTASKIGPRSPINSPKITLKPNGQANNVDNAGTITFLLSFPKIHGLWMRRISFSGFTENRGINGRTSQKRSLGGNFHLMTQNWQWPQKPFLLNTEKKSSPTKQKPRGKEQHISDAVNKAIGPVKDYEPYIRWWEQEQFTGLTERYLIK